MKAEITAGRPETPHARKRVFSASSSSTESSFFSHPVVTRTTGPRHGGGGPGDTDLGKYLFSTAKQW